MKLWKVITIQAGLSILKYSQKNIRKLYTITVDKHNI